VFEGQPASIRLAPHVTTTIRLPEAVNSVVLGDSNRFQAEYSPKEPLLVFARPTASDIAAQLEAQGFHIEKRQIDLHEPIKALGVYRVPIRLHADVKPEVRVWVIKQ